MQALSSLTGERATFRGELVPQDPRDEPAAKLLERTRIVREQAAAASRADKSNKKKVALVRVDLGAE